MKSCVFASTVVAASAGFCCYEGCGKAPTSCSAAGEYCSSADTCGSCGGEWCGDTPTPSPPTPTPPTPPTPTPPTPIPGDLTLYCPSPDDLFQEYGSTTLEGGGWTIRGDGRVSTKTTFHTLGGYVEFDMDTTNAHAGVNTNIYTISPDGDFCGKDCYCDIQDNGSPVCMELDIIENNGNCKFASTWHTKGGFGGNGCDAGGCAHNGDLPGGSFHMKSTWGSDGMWLTYLNDEPLNVNNYLSVTDEDKRVVQQTMSEKGVVVISSQWTGWVPGDGCPGGGDLGSSEFSIRNLKVLGKVLRGPEPRKCSEVEQISV